MKVVAIVQARLGSSRLPGKVLAEIAGRPMLGHVVGRLQRARRLHQVGVATSDLPQDDALARFCEQEQWACVRGSERDVLDRYRQAADAFSADTIVRITADCPLLDPHVVDQVIARFEDSGADYASNTLLHTFPDGLDVEVFSRRALECAWQEARQPFEREHVTPYLRTAPAVRRANLAYEGDPDARAQRWTVDDERDLEFVRRVYDVLGASPGFAMGQVLALLTRRPELRQLNQGTAMNEGYYHSLYDAAEAGAAPKRPTGQSEALLARSRKVIPGGAQTFSKGRTQYVHGVSPLFLQRGRGSRVWDVDGGEYVDYVQGLLPNILGYAHPGVNAAVARQAAEGHSFSLPHPLEVELAERLVQAIPCAEMVRFGKNGSDATTGGVRAARAVTGRDHIACCGYHGWQDWYIGSTTRHAGVPAAVRALTHSFPYNDLAALERVLGLHPGGFAAVIMEPVNFVEPHKGYLQGVKALAHAHGALLIFDEICSGFHFGLGGAQRLYGVTPDLACFGKAMGNGYPISCIVGRADLMAVFEDIFFSFTFAGEVASMAAALKVLDILEETDTLARMETQGRRLQDGFNALAREAGLGDRFVCAGRPQWSVLRYRTPDGGEGLLERSLFQQEAVKRGILILATHNMTGAHDDRTTEQTLIAYAAIFKTLAVWLADSDPARFLEGSLIEPVFRVR